MTKPIILTVDDDPEVLGAIERDLRQQYRKDYRIIKASTGKEALETVEQLKKRGSPIALFIVDQRMPEMSGTEFLRMAMKYYPESCKVLLTAYADTEAAIESINEIDLDHYLMKPWDPPEQKLYPVLDDLLSRWSSEVRLPFEGIRVVGVRWTPMSYAVKDFMSRNNVPYQWVDIDLDSSMRELVTPMSDGLKKLPVVLFPDGQCLVCPPVTELAEKVGLQTKATLPFYDLAIVGGGPAGLANAVYGASEGLKTVLIEQNAPGGQAGSSSRIENYLGFPAGISGADLAQRATAQARKFGAEILTAQEVIGIERQDPYRIIRLSDGTKISSYAVLISTGMKVQELEVPGIKELLGIGVYYGAAMSEGVTYKDKHVCIVGAANSAGQGAMFFSRYASKVTMIVRSEGLHTAMSHYLRDRIHSTTNIHVLIHSEVTSVKGKEKLEEIQIINHETGKEEALQADGLFIFIGAAPRSEMAEGLVERDEKGFILTGPDLPRTARGIRGWNLERDPYMFETNVPGIFAAGDIRAGANRRVAAAVGEGSAAIYTIQKYLETV